MWGIQVSTLIPRVTLNPTNELHRFSPYLPTKPSARILRIKASSSSSESSKNEAQEVGVNVMDVVLEKPVEKKNIFGVLVDVPKSLWRRTLRPMSDFGFGRKSIWEGGVGLFLGSGVVVLALSMVWLKGFVLKSGMKKYEAVVEFEQACGICTGTPVRIRGVTVGSVVKMNPSLKSIEAVVEIEDERKIIPTNSLIEVNQSGLLMETMIDITPRDPLPTLSFSPLHPNCAKEGLIVCDRQKIRGHQGVSLDALVGIFTRLGREMEEIGVSKAYLLAERVAAVIEEAQPLLTKMEAMAEDVQPLLAEVRESGLLKDVESLTRTLTKATEELRGVNSSVLTPENTERIRKSIYSFLFTLKNIENISSDVSGFTGDEATRKNLKLLIKSLSRLL